MNNIRLHGTLTNIQSSHNIDDIQYDRATLIVPRPKQQTDDIINLRFKKFTLPFEYKDITNVEIDLIGQLRSYSQRTASGKNKVELYVFTYFDLPAEEFNPINSVYNHVELDGRICKIDSLRTTNTGKNNIHLILANNLIVSNGDKKLNSYVPCIAWGNIAKQLSNLTVNTPIQITGELHSREYIKHLDNNDSEIRVAHECLITDFKVLENI